MLTEKEIYEGFKLLEIIPQKNNYSEFYQSKKPFKMPSVLKDINISMSITTDAFSKS